MEPATWCPLCGQVRGQPGSGASWAVVRQRLLRRQADQLDGLDIADYVAEIERSKLTDVFHPLSRL